MSASDNINLTAARFHALTDDAPTVEPQPPGGDSFAPAALLFGAMAVQSASLIAIARV